MSTFRAVIIGNESLAIQCGEMLREAGHTLAAVVTRNADVAEWAEGAGVPVVSSDDDLVAALSPLSFDWLLSIANLDMIPDAVLALPTRGAANFHDGPLPRYAGLNAPVWALLAGEAEYGISWHLIEGGVDEGRLLAQSFFDVDPDEKQNGVERHQVAFQFGINSYYFFKVASQIVHLLLPITSP